MAATRRLWGWAIRSPRHFVGTVAAAAVLVVLIGQLVGTAEQADTRAAAAPSGTPTPTAAAPSPPSAPSPARVAPPVPVVTDTLQPMPAGLDEAPAEALQVATEWAEAFVSNTSAPNRVWLAQLEPYTMPALIPAMRSIDPSNVPASEVTGQPVPTQVGDGFVRVLVPTDNARLELDLTLTGQGWLVGDYRRADG